PSPRPLPAGRDRCIGLARGGNPSTRQRSAHRAEQGVYPEGSGQSGNSAEVAGLLQVVAVGPGPATADGDNLNGRGPKGPKHGEPPPAPGRPEQGRQDQGCS